MGISLVSGNLDHEVTIDPASKAVRASLYTSEETARFVSPIGSYSAPINMGQFGTPAAGSFVWALKNGFHSVLEIRRILGNVGYAGVAGATTQTYQFVKFRGINPTGGTLVQPVRKRSTDNASRVFEVRQAITALTTTGIIIDDNPFFSMSYPRQPAGPSFSSQMEFTISRQEYDQIQIGPNEGIGIRLLVAGIAGDSINGCVIWDERETS